LGLVQNNGLVPSRHYAFHDPRYCITKNKLIKLKSSFV
jgi:hypothetical protein